MIKTKAERIRPQGMGEILNSGQDTPDKSLAESLDSLSVEGVCKWLRWTNLFLLWPFLLFLLPLTTASHPLLCPAPLAPQVSARPVQH